jgi:hypothetical protein
LADQPEQRVIAGHGVIITQFLRIDGSKPPTCTCAVRIVARRQVALVALSLLVLGTGLAAVAPDALAAVDCPTNGSTSWNNTSGGSWDDSANWTNGIPTGSCTFSIALPGTYTVVMAAGGFVAGGTVGAATGTQTLQVAGSPSATVGGTPTESEFRFDGDLTVAAHGVLQYTAIGTSPGGALSDGAGKILNSGVVRTDAGSSAGNRDIQNSVVNNASGTIALHTDTNTCGCGNTHTWTNSGTITTDTDTTSTFTGTAAGVLFTQSAGTFTNNGRAEIGGGYTITGGTTTGNPIEICGFVDAPGSGAASFEFDSLPDLNCGNGGSGQITGDIGAATQVLVHSDTSGVFASVQTAITNHGTITVDGGPGQGQINGQAVTNAGTLNLQPTTGAPSVHITSTFTNTGTMNLAADRAVDLASKFTQAGGSVHLGAGSTFSANNDMDLSGGTIANSGTFTENGQLNHTGGNTTGQPIELCGGNLNAPGPGTASFVIGRIANCSSMGLDGDIGSGDTVRIESASAQIDVSQEPLTNHGTLTVVSDPNHLVQIHGNTLTNAGTLDTTGSNFPTNLVNSGTWTVTPLDGVNTNVTGSVMQNGGALDIAGTLNVSNGATITGGTVTVDGTLNPSNTLPISGGVLRGVGTVGASVTNSAGTVHPGHSPGILSITGDYTQGTGGTLAVDIKGPTAGTGYSRLAVTGNATLGGALHVATSAPQTGTLLIITAAAATGAFKSTSFTGQTFSVRYTPTGVDLTGTAPPTVTALPTVKGTVAVGKTLTGSTGSFTGRPTSYAYRWLRCSRTGNNCGAITQATHATYKITNADSGHRLRIQVTATNNGGHASATSAASGIVPPTFTLTSVTFTPRSFKARTATRLTFRLSLAASVSLSISHRVSGRKTHGHCRPTARTGKHCTTVVTAYRTTHRYAAGAHRTRLHLTQLKPGHYKATVRARDNYGDTKTVSIRLIVEHA